MMPLLPEQSIRFHCLLIGLAVGWVVWLGVAGLLATQPRMCAPISRYRKQASSWILLVHGTYRFFAFYLKNTRAILGLAGIYNPWRWCMACVALIVLLTSAF